MSMQTELSPPTTDSGSATLPASFGQERLWFLEQVEPGQPTYHVPFVCEIAGELNEAALHASLLDVVQHHEILRTSFAMEQGELLQIIRDDAACPFETRDFSKLSAADRASEIEAFTRPFVEKPFDLKHGPLLRTALLRLAADSYHLLLNIHHLIVDGWSIGILLRELDECYTARLAGRSPVLGTLPIQYGDFAVWQREALANGALDEQLLYWKQHLGELPAPLELPGDKTPSLQRTSAGGELFFSLPAELGPQAIAFAKSQGLTPFMLFSAAFSALLFRYTGREDFLFGVPVTNRTRPETERLIGYFVNTATIRADFRGDPTVQELCARIRDETIGALAHGDYPFEKLVVQLQPERRDARSPLFSTMFAVANHPAGDLQLGPARLRLRPLGVGRAKFDLLLELEQEGDTLRGYLTFNSELFTLAAMERLLAHYSKLLGGMIASPTARVSRLPLLSEAERRQILITWNDTARPFPADEAIDVIFARQAAKTPDAIAVSENGHRTTYAELNALANRYAHDLPDIAPGDLIGLSATRGLRFVAAAIGILRAGGAYVPLSREDPPERHQQLVEGCRQVIDLNAEPRSTDTTSPRSRANGDSAAYVLFTSGSTGKPKGVVVPHRAIARLVINSDYVQFQPDDVVSMGSNLCFDAATFEMWGALLNGGRLVVSPRETLLTPTALGKYLAAENITTLFLTTSLFHQMAQQAPGIFAGLRTLVFGGEAADADSVRLVLENGRPKKLVNGYGPTETTTFAVCHVCEDPTETRVPIGRPIANTTVYILDAHLGPVPIGIVGELYIGGPGVALGYHGAPELTAERFVETPYGRLYRTGDLTRWRPDGLIDYLGRRDQQLKMRGFRVEPGEIETALRAIPGIRECAVVPLELHSGKHLVAYFTTDGRESPPVAAIRAEVARTIPVWMLPSAFVPLERLPLTPNGKLDVRALPEPSFPRHDVSEQEPQTALHAQLVELWEDLLGRHPIGIHDDFFELGGHSLLAAKMLTAVEARVGLLVPFWVLFESATIANLADFLVSERHGESAEHPGVTVQPREKKTPSLFLRGEFSGGGFNRRNLTRRTGENRPFHAIQPNGLHAKSPPPIVEATAADRRLDVGPTDTTSVFVFPPTPAQRRFWLLDQLQPGGNPALNMSLATRWHGPLDHSILRLALNEVLTRHEALRTTFDYERGQLRQLIAPSLHIDLPILDASAFREASASDLPAQLILEEARQRFDLRLGPLLRARLLRLAPQEHVLLVTVHHIVSDGWSNAIFTRDLCAFYNAFLEGAPAPLPDLAIQFADYAEWQQTQLTNDSFAEQRIYWRQKLAGDLPGLDLPFDRGPRTGPSVSGDVRSRVLRPELLRAVKYFGTSENASRFMIFFAVFQALLHRYTGREDFLVTSPSANRQRREFESLIGPFANPLLLRADLHGDPTFRELLGRVRNVSLEAFSNQDIPFEMLLDEFQAPRLQVNFHYDSGLQQPVNLPAGLTLELLPSVSVGTVYELSASVLEYADGARVELEYNPALFDPATIERMLGHYETLLESSVAGPTTPVSRLPLLTHDERKGLGLESGPLNGALPAPLDVRAALVQRVMEKPDAMAARHGRRELSCAELLARMESARNADKSDRIPSDLDQAAGWVAYWRARIDTPPPPVVARSPEGEASIAVAAEALRECALLYEGERMASCTPPGAAATEEIGAALLSNALLVYPTPGLLAEPAGALAAWLETENIAVACLAAATWNRLAAAIAARKVRKPSKLRLVIASEGLSNDGSFGRVAAESETGPTAGIRVRKRTVLESAGGTIALEDRPLQPITGRLRVLDSRSGEPLPIGVIGELSVGSRSTGNLARWIDAGSLDLLGSREEQTYARGFRIDARRTEAALCRIPGVRHALVRPGDSESNSRLVAYILPDLAVGRIPNDVDLRQHLHEQGLPDQLVPALFVPLKDIPVSAEDGHLDLAGLPSPPPWTAPESVQPYMGLQLQLLAIWEDVLGVRGIGIRDNFFDLGGNSLLAMRMLQRAELACGKVILPSALFRNPTVEHLAGEIAREVIDESPTLLRINDAGTRTPFFYLHGDLSGGGFYSLKLARALGPDQPFYVLPPQDIRMLPDAPSIEKMAAVHLDALRAVRPKGPYVIGGFCIGGLVAHELAQQIKASGDEVKMLLIIDAEPEDKALRSLRKLSAALGKLLGWDEKKRVAHFGRWAAWETRLQRWEAQNKQTHRGITSRIGDAFSFAYDLIRRRFRPPARAPKESEKLEAENSSDYDAASVFLWSAAGYDGRRYDGPMAVLLSEDVLRDSHLISRKWQELAPDVIVHPLKGSHLECITAHVDTLAATIQSSLETAEATRNGRETSPHPETGIDS